MNLEKAEDISKWKQAGLSWKEISKKYCSKYGDAKKLSGNLYHGCDLCNRAARFLGTERADYWQ